MPPADEIVSTPDESELPLVEEVVDPVVVVVLDATVLVVDVEGSVVELGALPVDEVPDCVVVLVVGTTSGAPEISFTPPDAAATTHHAASVTRRVATTQPSTYLVVLTSP